MAGPRSTHMPSVVTLTSFVIDFDILRPSDLDLRLFDLKSLRHVVCPCYTYIPGLVTLTSFFIEVECGHTDKPTNQLTNRRICLPDPRPTTRLQRSEVKELIIHYEVASQCIFFLYRGEKACVTVNTSRSGGEGNTGGGETASPLNYLYTTPFGWVLPHTKTRRRGVIDAVWLREFSSDIVTLRSEISRQATFVYVDGKPTHQEDCVWTDCRSDYCGAMMSHKDRVSAPEMTNSSRGSVNSFVPTRGSESRGATCREPARGEAKAWECYSDQRPTKVKTQELTQYEDSFGSEKPYVLDSRLNMYTVGGKCDEYSSMQSDISRDSGVFTTDDTSLISEVPGDKSLLEEMRDVLGDQDVSLEPSIHCGSLPLEETVLASKENGDCPVWLSRFSSSNDLSPEWGSQETCPFTCISPVTRRKNCTLEDSGSHSPFEESDSHVTPPAAVSRKEEEGFKARQYKACKTRKESLSSHSRLQQISELAELTNFFEGLSARVGQLRSGMKCLAGEVKETKRDLINLDERATQLLASTVSSRHRMTRIHALQVLDDRLQEEWWAAYDPNTVSSQDNYIV
ncbi:hypothetical protein GWK47_000206 [Chionoecetes opilio]|uniref:Uncharacterized protein n=1 Tax=Chionoecetes opilio TaxID=41210 RepID=A0A8J4XLJ6_CHIOP|nr:hypothetical protein GWK47_000206 [Chionoecetes opilio]